MWKQRVYFCHDGAGSSSEWGQLASCCRKVKMSCPHEETGSCVKHPIRILLFSIKATRRLLSACVVLPSALFGARLAALVTADTFTPCLTGFLSGGAKRDVIRSFTCVLIIRASSLRSCFLLMSSVPLLHSCVWTSHTKHQMNFSK